MSLPFTSDQFLALMHRYNEAIWPAQLVLNGVALAAIGLVAARGRWRSRFIFAALATLWTWSGLVYHLRYFSEINPAAVVFGLLFLAGAALFAWRGVIDQRLTFSFASGRRAALGIAVVAYALVLYPLTALVSGHRYPEMPTFGTPCPTVIFTIGMLMFVEPPYPRYLFIAP